MSLLHFEPFWKLCINSNMSLKNYIFVKEIKWIRRGADHISKQLTHWLPIREFNDAIYIDSMPHYMWLQFCSVLVCCGYMITWWRHQMEAFSALLALCAGNSPSTGEFPSQRPETQSFAVFLDVRLNKRLRKQWRRRWFETPSRSLWRHCHKFLCIHVMHYPYSLGLLLRYWGNRLIAPMTVKWV